MSGFEITPEQIREAERRHRKAEKLRRRAIAARRDGWTLRIDAEGAHRWAYRPDLLRGRP